MALTKTLKKYLGFTKIDVYTVQRSLFANLLPSQELK